MRFNRSGVSLFMIKFTTIGASIRYHYIRVCYNACILYTLVEYDPIMLMYVIGLHFYLYQVFTRHQHVIYKRCFLIINKRLAFNKMSYNYLMFFLRRLCRTKHVFTITHIYQTKSTLSLGV